MCVKLKAFKLIGTAGKKIVAPLIASRKVFKTHRILLNASYNEDLSDRH
jgi:hypothetical protein